MSTIKEYSKERTEAITELFTETDPDENWLKLSARYTEYVDQMAFNPDVRVRIAPLPKDWQDALDVVHKATDLLKEAAKLDKEAEALENLIATGKVATGTASAAQTEWAAMQRRNDAETKRAEVEELKDKIPEEMRRRWAKLGMAEPIGIRRNDIDRIEINGPKVLGRHAWRAGSLDPARPLDREDMATLHGVVCHEVGHADFTRWDEDVPRKLQTEDGGRAVWEWINILEEIRMEARVCEERPFQRRWLRSAVNTLFNETVGELDDLPDGEHPKVTAARVATLTMGRVEAGSLTDTDTDKVREAVGKVLSTDEITQLRRLWWDAIDCEDGDTASLADVARKIMELVDDPGARIPPPMGIGVGLAGGTADDKDDDDGDRDGESPMAAAQDDTKAAEDKAKEEGKPQPMDDPKKEERDYSVEAKKKSEKIFHGYTKGATYGVRSWRQPTPEERRHAARLANILTRARFRQRTKVEITSHVPPGNLRTREALTEAALEAQGLFPVVEPWKRVKRKRVEAPPLRVGLISDISGSMSSLDELVQTMTWTFAEAVRKAGGTFAAALFGETTRRLCRPGQILKKVPVWNSVAGSEDFCQAFDAVHGALTLFGEGALLVYITDGHLVRHGEPTGAKKRLDRLVASGGHGLQVYQTKSAIVLNPSCPLVFGRPEQILTLVEKELTRSAAA